jgi:aspartate 1-decarboxylase
MELEEILGIWRSTNGDIILDFNIRTYNPESGKGLSLFTIYGKDVNGNKVGYEWQGAVADLIDNGDSTFTISIEQMIKTEDKPEYQNLKVWLFTNKVLTLELGNGDRVDFDRLR